ncbi:MAG: hypothetical protein K2X81_16040, partial [Candidatus Obscuribacterales bacterium]|nr:hypothetical protein [Candidatus Obscuribacterales bacterium]
IKLPIDATIGLSERDRHPSEVGLVQQLSNGGIVCPADNTKIKVLGAGEMRLYGCPYKIANVKILDGKFKGRKGWVIRDDVMDTPLAVAINQFRSGSKHLDKEMIEDCDPDEKDPMYSRPIIRRRPSASED